MFKLSTDEVIKSKVVDQLRFDAKVDASDIKVEVDNNKVTLEGSVSSFSGKTSAEDDAYLISGVFDVENNLEVEFEVPPAIPTDDEIETRINNTLLWNTEINSQNINVEVENQWVTLTGDVDSYWKKYLAENKTLNVRGVVGVTNEIVVVPTEKVTDEAIAEDIIKAIERNVNVLADNVTVKVEDGKVTLTGEVPSWSAKNSAFIAASSAWGVKEVENKILINP